MAQQYPFKPISKLIEHDLKKLLKDLETRCLESGIEGLELSPLLKHVKEYGIPPPEHNLLDD